MRRAICTSIRAGRVKPSFAPRAGRSQAPLVSGRTQVTPRLGRTACLTRTIPT
jgi:hypothetical protein